MDFELEGNETPHLPEGHNKRYVQYPFYGYNNDSKHDTVDFLAALKTGTTKAAALKLLLEMKWSESYFVSSNTTVARAQSYLPQVSFP